uniref:Ependymin n=1 Tax=Oryzias sinensis TaxID=183150 RepID=A0A8C7YDH4_9TELE
GGVSIVTQELAAFAKYSYDGLGKRIRLTEIGSYANATFQLDVLLLFKQGFMYKINNKDRTCFKKHLMEDFHPLAIPNDASLVGQAVLGSTSVQGEGLLVNTWTAKYLSTVTEFGCFPVNTLVSTDSKAWVLVSFYNNIMGIPDPQVFTPPTFCKGVQLEEEEEEDKHSFLYIDKNVS